MFEVEQASPATAAAASKELIPLAKWLRIVDFSLNAQPAASIERTPGLSPERSFK